MSSLEVILDPSAAARVAPTAPPSAWASSSTGLNPLRPADAAPACDDDLGFFARRGRTGLTDPVNDTHSRQGQVALRRHGLHLAGLRGGLRGDEVGPQSHEAVFAAED